MKRLNKLFMFTSSTTLLLPITLLVACTSPRVVAKPIDDNEFNKLIDSIETENDLLKYADIKFKNSRGVETKKEDIIPSQLKNESIDIVFKGKYKGQVSAIVTNVGVENSGNLFAIQTEATIYVQFKNNKTGTPKPKNFVIKGLNKNGNFDASGNRVVDDLAYFGGSSGYEEYAKKDQRDRFKYDNERYVSRLKRQLGNGSDSIDLKQYRGLNTKEDNIKKFNQQAEKSNFDTYYNAALKGFTLPVYGDNGQVNGLKVYEGPEVGKGPSEVDSLGRSEKPKTVGLARTIPNDIYKTAAIQTFQVNFTIHKDYEKEIEEAQDNIELFDSWNDEQIKGYIATQIRQLTLNFNDEVSQIDKQIAEAQDGRDTILSTLTKKKEELKAEYDKTLSELNSLNKESLKKWQQDEIKKYEERRKEKILQTSESGTMWIMDYIDVSHPTKFYFGTNSHVAKGIKDDMISFSLTRINSDINIGQTFGLNSYDRNFTKFTFAPKKDKKLSEAVSAIFHATDFLKESSNPVKLLSADQKSKYDKVGIFADFAVVEVDFAKLLNKDDYSFGVWNEAKDVTSQYSTDQNSLIEKITNGYAKSEKKVSFASDSLLDDEKYKKFDRKLDFNPKEEKELKEYKELDSLYILGYPTAYKDFYLDQYEDERQLKNKKYDFSLWINGEYKFYNKLVNREGSSSSFNSYETEKGNFLSYQVGYRSFIDKPGLTDAFIAVNRIGKKLYSLKNGKDKEVRKYFNYGLEILPRFYAPAGGASGSSVRTKDNKLLAVYHASNETARTGLAAVFRSKGYNYKGLFGTYNLGQYDLIYGGGKDQEKGKSYREVMLERNKSNGEKSALFPKGFEDTHIPSEFKFNGNGN
ncbi:Immunoglobulin protease MIP [Mycoplasma feriruminatoris]|uniref:Immunoglobulin protease MIP n=1 Tax=Mycoplasma feriruminatoris TaxID=1179777 RepID=A0ABY8HWL7_9MOLU|nr:lipoprotein [Mycoplasma feriruminatoris]WFQ93391.1 Immunoglobulin protease MIP [Mycoplasma feriruminatoris]